MAELADQGPTICQVGAIYKRTSLSQVYSPTQAPMAPLVGGEYSLGEARRGVAPPNLGFILASFTSKFADVLGLVG